MALPPQLLESLTKASGYNPIGFAAVHASNEQITSIRKNPDKSSHQEELSQEIVPWCPMGYYLSKRPFFTFDPLFHAGSYYVQEASSMFLWHAISEVTDKDDPIKVLDLCAAPGGKTTLLASFFKNGLIVANEVIKSRASVLVENITKWGTNQVIVTNNDPSHFKGLPGYFDLIIIDAPCSGSGLFRKDPNAVDEWSEDAVMLCHQRQQRILADVLGSLRENGILIYSTCSYSIAENEGIADWLVTEMAMQTKQLNVPAEWGIVETESPIHKAFGYRFYPDKVKGEGFFMAVFQNRKTTDSKRLKGQPLSLPSKSEIVQVNHFFQIPETFQPFNQSAAIRIMKTEWFPDLQILANCLFIKKAGIEIGSIKGKDIVPSHELALSTFALEAMESIDVTEKEALQYLRRNDLTLVGKNGWNLVRYCGLPLGWVKVLPNRINNYYPASWRILKE